MTEQTAASGRGAAEPATRARTATTDRSHTGGARNTVGAAGAAPTRRSAGPDHAAQPATPDHAAQPATPAGGRSVTEPDELARPAADTGLTGADPQPADPAPPASAPLDPGAAAVAPLGPGRPGPGPSWLLATLALAWLAAMLWVAHASISADVGAVALATAASSLPPVVSAGLVAGAAVGLLAATLLTHARPLLAERAGIRPGVALAAGAVAGLLAGGAFVLGSGSDPARMAVAGTLAAAVTVGSAIAGARASRVVAAIVTAGLAVFATGFLLSLFKQPLLDLYGAGADAASQEGAAGYFAATAAIASGMVAGLTAYRVLGGARRDPAVRWPAYLVAGAGSGVLLLVAELLLRTGGAELLRLVREISDFDRTAQTWADGSRVNNALVVLFVGAIVALFALGRGLGPRAEIADPTDDEPDRT